MIRIALFLLALVPIAFGGVTSSADARDFLQSLSENVLSQLADGGADVREIRRRFRKMYENSFDVKAMPPLVLGPYWRKASATQKREFKAIFEEFLAIKYADKFKELNLKSFAIKGVHQVREDIFVISSAIEDEAEQAVEVDWRIRFKDGYKIYDISIAGISMVTTQREDFTSVIRRAGGDIDFLTNRLKLEVAEAESL